MPYRNVVVRLDSETGTPRKTVNVFIPFGGLQAELRIPQGVPCSSPEKEWATTADLVREVGTILVAAMEPR